MKLYYAAPSPFARKARVCIIELSLQEQVELVAVDGLSPVANHAELNTHNPLGMIPALELDNGENLYDSPVICEYLNQLGEGALYPADIKPRFQALQLHALADGIMELSVALRYELAMRPEDKQWSTWIEHQNEKINRGLDRLEQQCAGFKIEPTIGELTAACALGYRDFRFAESDWRLGRPALVEWYEGIMQRESLAETVPVL
ncbi:MAG: glutathione S-transferase N-terminal domain-containing protein [Thiolinea sp.]